MKQLLFVGALFAAGVATGDEPLRARDLGIPFDGQPGKLNAITDVRSVTVGHEHSLMICRTAGQCARV